MIQDIINKFKVFKKELHFAFMFASPILLLKKKNEKSQPLALLNFNKEYVKIVDSIAAAQVQLNITKR